MEKKKKKETLVTVICFIVLAVFTIVRIYNIDKEACEDAELIAGFSAEGGHMFDMYKNKTEMPSAPDKTALYGCTVDWEGESGKANRWDGIVGTFSGVSDVSGFLVENDEEPDLTEVLTGISIDYPDLDFAPADTKRYYIASSNFPFMLTSSEDAEMMEKAVMEAYGVKGFPYTVLYDEEMEKISAAQEGEAEELFNKAREELESAESYAFKSLTFDYVAYDEKNHTLVLSYANGENKGSALVTYTVKDDGSYVISDPERDIVVKKHDAEINEKDRPEDVKGHEGLNDKELTKKLEEEADEMPVVEDKK